MAICLAISVGSLTGLMDMPEAHAELYRGLVHVLLAFAVYGQLEALRQNVSLPTNSVTFARLTVF